MFKKIPALSLVLLLFLALLLLLPVPPAGAAGKKVVFIRYRITPGYFTTVIDGFKEAMTRRGYLEGINIEYVDVLTRSADESSIPEVVAAVQKYKETADMFITCGWVSLQARELLKDTKVPQLFVPVLESVALKMLPSISEEPNTNLSGIYLMYPPEKILRIARFIMPRLQNYAYVYDSRIPADLVYKKEYEGLNKKERYGITLHHLDLAQGVEKTVRLLKDLRIESFGGIVGSFQNREALARADIPVISSFPLDVDQESIKEYLDDNMLAGLFNPFGYCGTQAAEMTADIFDGRNTIEKTRPRPAKQVAFINLKAAKHLNMPVSFDVLETVDIIIK